MKTGPSKVKATLLLEAEPGAILAFERFVGGLGFLSSREGHRLAIAGGEILDNIVKHATPLEDRRIAARVSRGDGRVILAFYFRSPTFAAFVAADAPAAAGAEPFFDPAHRRWRGMGLVMCRNLASSVSFRPGSLMDRIFLEFRTE
jgi:anti-sigma regulatory factor (Ser/Thr protein kinase)